jgi:hypothetical protein
LVNRFTGAAAKSSETQEIDHEFMMDGFDPVKALQSLSNPATPEFSRAVPKIKDKSRKSLFASAIEAVDEQEAAKSGKRKKKKCQPVRKALF